MRAVTHRYFACLDAEHWTDFGTLWTEDASVRAVGARPRDGREAIVAFYAKLFTPWVEHEDRPVRLVVCEADQVVTAEVRFSGLTADGRRVGFDAVDVIDFSGDRISRLTNWYDIDYARRSLAGTAA